MPVAEDWASRRGLLMPSLAMKRKINGVGAMDGELEEVKRGRLENGSEKKDEEGPETRPASKCPICLWPAGAPQCYHQGGGATQPAQS